MSTNRAQNIPPSKEKISPIAEGGSLYLISQEASQNIRDLVQPNSSESNTNKQAVIQMGTAMSQLSYKDYLTLDGILKDLVKRTHRHNFAALASQTPNDTLKTIFLALDTLSDKSNCAIEATLLLRRCYPFGTNIVNKYWDEKEGSFGFDATKPGVIRATSTTDIAFSPGKDKTTCEIEAEGKSVTLKEGEQFIIGREYSNTNAFGASVDASIDTQLPINNDSKFSRASILLILQDGILYIFDKGSRNPISAIQANIRVDYDTARSADGSYGYSKTDRGEIERDADESL